MQTEKNKIQWLPILLIAWNLFDIAVHIAVDMVEVLRVSGNVLAIAVAVIVLTGITRSLAHDILVGSAVVVVILNSIFSYQDGYGGAPPSNVDQSGLCERDDVLTFTSEVFEDGLFISGDISVTLEVASSAPDTAFTAKLIEVFPDGSTFNIRDSITSLAYRNGSDEPLVYLPGEHVTITIDFWPIAWQLQPGSSLRLDISSSNFPKFHAHTNRAGVWSEQTGADIAVQTIYGGQVDLQIEP